MNTIAIYNMKGGVGKTTMAVNLSFLAAQSGLRTLLWDLDPQAASSFAFRIRPHGSGFVKGSLQNGLAFCNAIRQTDYDNLCLLPAGFAYHKLDRLMGSSGNPERHLTSLLEETGRDFDTLFIDCPAGSSKLIEAILTTADTIVVPTLPTVLSLRMVAELARLAERSRSRSRLVAVFNMVDRRKTLHRRARELAASHTEIFLSTEIPYASVVEQMSAHRMPITVFAAHAPAAVAFAEIWAELQTCLHQEQDNREERPWVHTLRAIESLTERLESTERPIPASSITSTVDEPAHGDGDVDILHRFDTDQRDLERRGHTLELRERNGGEFLVAAQSDMSTTLAGRAEARIDRSWAVQILAGEISPLEALERTIGSPRPPAIEHIRAAVGGRHIRRVDTRQLRDAVVENTMPVHTSAVL